MPPTTPTTAPPALPDLAGYEPYAKALARHGELTRELDQARADLAAARAELNRLRPPRKVEHVGFEDVVVTQPPPVDPVKVAAEAIAGGADVTATVATPDQVTAAKGRVDEAQFRVYALEDALDLFVRRTLSPERAHAQQQYAAGVFDRVYQPALREAVKAWVAAAVALHRLAELRERIGAAGLWTAPMAVTEGPPESPWGDPSAADSIAAHRIGLLVAEGTLDAADPLLAGVYPPREMFAGVTTVADPPAWGDAARAARPRPASAPAMNRRVKP